VNHPDERETMQAIRQALKSGKLKGPFRADDI
jgi:hypothetical protein